MGQWEFYDRHDVLYGGGDVFIDDLASALVSLMQGGRAGYTLVTNLSKMEDIITIGQGKNVYIEESQTAGWNPTGSSGLPNFICRKS